jgi:hypothetical protein
MDPAAIGALPNGSSASPPCGRVTVVLKIATGYEAASRRRIPPPAFDPLVQNAT